jgi:hypothetical protein
MYEQLNPARALMGSEATKSAPVAAATVLSVPRRDFRTANARMVASNR